MKIKFAMTALLIFALISCAGKNSKENSETAASADSGFVEDTRVKNAVIYGPDNFKWGFERINKTYLYLWWNTNTLSNISLEGIEPILEDDIFGLIIEFPSSSAWSYGLINWVDISGMDFSPFKSLPNLKEIRFEDAQFNKMPDFSVMPSLESIYLWHCEIMSLDGIEKATQIKDLWLDFKNEYYGDFIHLSALTELEELRIVGSRYWTREDKEWVNTIFHASDLSGLSKLKKLNIFVDNILDLQGIPALTQLEELGLKYNIANMHELAGLKNLKKLRSPIPDSAVLPDFFGTITNLTELELYGNGRTVDLSPLRNLRNLEHLKIGDYWHEKSPDSTIMSLDFLATLTNLTTLEIASNGNTLDITPLKNLKNLEEVSLYNFTITNFHVLNDLPLLEKVATYGSEFYPEDNNKLKNLWVGYEPALE